jgi:hypothetical protein
MDGFISDIQNPGKTGADVDIGVSATGISSGACYPLEMDLPWGTYSVNPCPHVQPLKDVLGWFLYMITAYFLVDLATSRPGG